MTGVGSYLWRYVASPKASAIASSACPAFCLFAFGIGDTYWAGRRRSTIRFVGWPLSSSSQDRAG
jgi:hypothetical protein